MAKKTDTTIVKSVLIPRLIHVVDPKPGQPLRMQTASESGRLMVYKVTEKIFHAVLGSIHGEERQFRNLGLRRLVQVRFRGHLNSDDVMVSLDIVPKRMFVRGAAPVEFGKAVDEGFEVRFDEDINGFDVRSCYAGMSEKALFSLLDALRSHTWGNKKTATIDNHKVDVVDDTTFRVRPISAKKSPTF